MEITVHGELVFIDEEDIEIFNKSKPWRLHLSRGKKYLRSCVKGRTRESRKQVYFHRLIMGAEDGIEVDHINGNSLDNRKENLRKCTRKQNCMNRRESADNSTGYRGVQRMSNGKYGAEVRANRIKYWIGVFDTPQAAHEAYIAKARELHGEYAGV